MKASIRRPEVKYNPAEGFRPYPLKPIAMDTFNFADGATVVAGPVSIANHKELSRERSHDFPAKPYSVAVVDGLSKAKTVSGNDFSKADFAIEDRPFCVPVGKDGITAALQKLDKQLQQVGATSSHTTRSLY